MQRQAEWNSFKNVLCIRPDNLGDLLMTTPALRTLKESVPGRRVTLLASSAGTAITPYISCIDEVITYDPPWQGVYSHTPEDVSVLIDTLKQKSFDAAVIFNVYSQNPMPAAMICYMAGIPRVAGYCRENPYGLMSDWVPDKEPLFDIKHEVMRQLDLVRTLGAAVKDDSLSLDIPEGVLKSTHERLSELGIDHRKPWLMMHPGVSEARRQYPPELFAEVAHAIAEELHFQVLLTGTDSEKELTGYIAEAAGDNVHSIAGRLSLAELIALIKLSPLVIANNTGPVHIAAAVGTPVVVLYALTNPQHSPWKVRHTILPFDVPQSMRSRNTMITYAYNMSFTDPPAIVKPQEVIDAVRKMLLKHREAAVQRTEVVRV